MRLSQGLCYSGRTELVALSHTRQPWIKDYEVNPRRLFDSRAARELLHAMPKYISGSFERCSTRIKYSRNIFNLTPYHLNLTSKGYIRTFFYNGDHDMRMPYIATLDWIKSLNYTEIEKWHPWYVGDQIAGYAVRFSNNLLFAILRAKIWWFL